MELITVICFAMTCLFNVVQSQSCTKKVLVESGTGRHKQVQMVRKIPAKCSNWDKAWVWITGMDCGTKYKMETVNFPSATSQIYQTQKVCCPNEKNCYDAGSEAQKDNGGGLDENDQKFLAITFGSATAALVIILLIIVLSFCRKQQPRFIENFFNRRHRMYEEDIIGVQPSAPFFEGSDYHYKNGGATRLIESEYEEIPEYNAKDKYPVLETCSDGYNQEISTERRVSHQNNYTRDLLISLASGDNVTGTTQNTEGETTPSSDAISGSYENAAVEMAPSVQETNTRDNESLSKTASDSLAMSSLPSACRNDMSVTSAGDRHNTSEFNSPSKCSNVSSQNDYIDFGNIVVPNCEHNAAVSLPSPCDQSIAPPPPRAHSYEKLDMSTRNNAEELYDALNGAANEKNVPNTPSGS